MSMAGKTFAHYEITSQLGKGGMGQVCRANTPGPYCGDQEGQGTAMQSFIQI